MKIVLDARSLCLKQRGMPTYVLHLCKLLPQVMSEYEFVFVINSKNVYNEPIIDYQARLNDVVSPPNVSIVDIPSLNDIYWEQLKLPSFVRQIDADLLHMPCNRVCLTSTVKQIVTFHDISEWHNLNILTRSWLRSLKRHFFYTAKITMYKWLTYRLGTLIANHILTVSESSKKSIIESFPYTDTKITAVYHGIPHEYLDDRVICPLANRKGVLMLGGNSKIKNSINMIKAFASVPEDIQIQHPLIIAGATDDARFQFQSLCDKLSIQNVTILGWIDQPALIKLFSSARTLLFASRVEGFGFPLVQAMARGTPAVTSTAEVLCELGGNAILAADAEDFLGIGRNLEIILTNDELWYQLQKNSFIKTKVLTWENTINQVSALYTSV